MIKNINTERLQLFNDVIQLSQNGNLFQYYNDTYYNGRSLLIRDNELLHFASCSYMGLENHSMLVEAVINAVKRYGTQNSMSRAMVSTPLYLSIQENLSKIFNAHVIIYPTVTLAHCSALPALVQEKDAIILDSYVHNSVRMASQLCIANGTFSVLAKHNDIEHLKYLIYRLKKEGYKNIWYCADGIYSIHGDKCNVKGIEQLLNEEEDFYAYIDDAHGIGWYGKSGCGYVADTIPIHDKMVLVASFNKSFAAAGGGIVLKNKELADFVKYTGQTMIFSGPIQPPMLGALYASTQLHLSDEIVIYQEELKKLIAFFKAKCHEYNLPLVTKDITPIQLVRIGSLEKTYMALSHLLTKGIFAFIASYPAVARGDEGIRITITRYLKEEDIEKFILDLSEILLEINEEQAFNKI